MGKTVPSYRMALEAEILSWSKFAEALNTQDQDAFEALMDAARYCMAAGIVIRAFSVSLFSLSAGLIVVSAWDLK